MNIKIVMRSQLDCHLKPDFKLINEVKEELIKEGKCSREQIEELMREIRNVDGFVEMERIFAKNLKDANSPALKEYYTTQKKVVTAQADKALELALLKLCEIGGGDKYNYRYDLHFNRVVAGLMGSTCYMQDTFEKLQQKGIRNILAIASVVEGNGHHSTFGHSHLTLEITGIPKALAMVLNNEKEYCTSEKSARYTVMKDIDPKELDLFTKWKFIFADEINKVYGGKTPFFDDKGIKIEKLAQENARYLISVFTPSNMVYTTSFRQLNYLCHWFQDVINDPKANEFYKRIKPEMQEFVNFVVDNNLYSELLEDHKDRKLSLFGGGILNEHISHDVYSMAYPVSFACLAQLHRHRTIHYHIDELPFRVGVGEVYVPQIIKGNKDLVEDWYHDFEEVEHNLPQGTLVPVIERGMTEDFLLKAKERVCVLAQKEVRDLTQQQCGKFALALAQQAQVAHKTGYFDIEEDITDMQTQFEKLSKGSRCTNGYKCQSPCGFKEGVNLTSEV